MIRLDNTKEDKTKWLSKINKLAQDKISQKASAMLKQDIRQNINK